MTAGLGSAVCAPSPLCACAALVGHLYLRRGCGKPLPRAKSGEVKAESHWCLVRMCKSERGRGNLSHCPLAAWVRSLGRLRNWSNESGTV